MPDFNTKMHQNRYGDILYRLQDIGYSDLLVENRKIFIPHMYLVSPQGVTQTPSEFRENVWCW